MDDNELWNVLEKHKKWLETKGMSGARADFTQHLGQKFWTDDQRCITINETKFNLDGVVLNDCDLSEAILSNISLQNAKLSRAHLFKANLRGANLTNADLTGAQFQAAELENVTLTGVIAIDANFQNANFYKSTLRNVDLHASQIQGANLEKANLQGACLDGLDLSNMNLKGSNLTGATLIGTNLSGANLSDAIMDGCSMQEAILDRATLEGASLVNANLKSASLHEANLKLARLEGSQFTGGARLDGASFQRASLCGAVFKMANLVAVNFQGANLEGVDLSGALLHYAKFEDEVAIIKTEVINRETLKTEKKEEGRVFFTNIKNINWAGADVTAITISKRSVSMLPRFLMDSYGETFNIFSPKNNTIIRSIEFPKGYEQAGLAILSYFSKVIREKYININVQVSIKQNGHRITMVIETPEGTRDVVEETLYSYGLVVRGKLQPELFLEDKIQILELKQQMTFIKAQLESSRELSRFKDEHYNNEIAFLRELMMATQKSFPAQVAFNPSINVEANLMSQKKNRTEQRNINTGGGPYNEYIAGNYVHGNYINMSSNLEIATHEICALVDKLMKQGMTIDSAQEHIAKELSSQSKSDQSVKGKLLQWGRN